MAHLWINGIQYSNPIARVYHCGELLYEIPIGKFAESEIFVIDGVCEIEVRDRQIGITKSDCPNKSCVNTGFVSGAVPVICVPNRVEIRVVNAEPDLDGVTR